MRVLSGLEGKAMFEDEEPEAKKASKLVVGVDLSTISVAELNERITLLEAEIVRVRSEIDKKQSSKASAESFFNT